MKSRIHSIEQHLLKTSSLPSTFIQAVKLRREYYEKLYNVNFKNIPYHNFNYQSIYKKNCENVIGYTSVPIGIVGPININNKNTLVPLATTEGALIASINRGCKWISQSLHSKEIVITDTGMTRSPIIKCKSLHEISDIKNYILSNFKLLQDLFSSTTNHGKLKDVSFLQNGHYLHIRFEATTGNAMGMNIISKGVEYIMTHLTEKFPIEYITISGNTCVDKKASSINFIKGRGKHVVISITLHNDKFEELSKIQTNSLINLHIQKNLVGSSLSGTIGGNNANVSNIISAFYLSTGQDLGQIGTSSMSILNIEKTKCKKFLNISLTLPCLEIGTIGGGTTLETQRNCINIIGPSQNEIIEALSITIIAGELSLMSSLCKGDLVKAHMNLNRIKTSENK
jgi:hydroxymethylglutaryl-CoA reductase (NADPH)